MKTINNSFLGVMTGIFVIALLTVVMAGAASAQVNQEWIEFYNVPGMVTSLALDGNGNTYVTGWSIGTLPNIFDYATVKYDSAGVQQWVAIYNGPGNSTDSASCVKVDGNGNVYVTGWSMGSGLAYRDYATIKYNSSGNQLWVARYDGGIFDEASDLAVDGNDNVYVTGQSYGGATAYDAATVKYDTNGNQLWVVRYNGPGNWTDRANSLAIDGNGNVYITGTAFGPGAGHDYLTVKYNSAGQQLWAASYDYGVDDEANSLAVDGNGNVYVTGFSYTAHKDFATVKYDSTGTQHWVERYAGTGGDDDQGNAIAVDGNGNVYVAGYSWFAGSGDKYESVAKLTGPAVL